MASSVPKIMLGYQRAQLLFTGTKLGLWDFLASGPRPVSEIQSSLGLHERMLYDYLDALVSLDVLTRTGFKETAVYSVQEDAREFLVQGSQNNRASQFIIHGTDFYQAWGNLDQVIRTGITSRPKMNEDEDLFDLLYSDPEKLAHFMNYMASNQSMEFPAFAKKYDFSSAKTLVDIGGASGALCIAVSKEQPHMRFLTADLPKVKDFTTQRIESAGASEVVSAIVVDFFKDETFPSADIITTGNILHDWGEDTKRMIMTKAFNALPKGGQFVSIEQHIDNDRKKALDGFMMSLHMGVITEEGYNWSQDDFEMMAREVGFTEFKFLPLHESEAAIAIK